MSKSSNNCDCILKFANCYTKSRKTFTEIYHNILVVDNSCKASWLCDVGNFQSFDILRLVKDLHRGGYIQNELRVVKIEDDFFICSLPLLLINLSKALKSLESKSNSYATKDTVFIEIKNNKSSLSVDEQTKRDLISFLASLQKTLQICDKQNVVEVNIDQDLCHFIPTLFGVFLGYPVVYIDKNVCVIVTDLKLYQVKLSKSTECQFGGHNFVTVSTVISFSFPLEFTAALMEHVVLWKDRLYEGFEKKNLSVTFTEESRYIENVILWQIYFCKEYVVFYLRCLRLYFLSVQAIN